MEPSMAPTSLKKATVRKSLLHLMLQGQTALAVAWPQPSSGNDLIQNQLPVCKIVGGVLVLILANP